MGILLSILIMLLILSILVIVHEWGHYIAARIFKVKVNEFSIFMGPKLFQRVGKKTGTTFSIRCLPIGGYCAMEGEETTENSETAFCNKPWWQRTIILLAGVFMNIILAVAIVTVIFMIDGYNTRRAAAAPEHLPMAMVGLNPGDSITNFNGYSVFNSLDLELANYVEGSGDCEFTVKKANGGKEKYKLVRDINETSKTADIKLYRTVNKEKEFVGDYQAKWAEGQLTITFTRTDQTKVTYEFRQVVQDGKASYTCVKSQYDASGGVVSADDNVYNEAEIKGYMENYSPYKFGINFEYVSSKNVFRAMGNAVVYNVSLVKSVFNSLKWLITGRLGMDAMSGPIGLTSVVNDVVTAGSATIGARILALFNMAALISANLAAFNVLPIPGLDGGKLIFIVLELIRRGKKVPPEKEAMVSLIFLALLILFSIFIAGHDIFRLIKG